MPKSNVIYYQHFEYAILILFPQYVYTNIILTRDVSVPNVIEKDATKKFTLEGLRLNYWHYMIEGIIRLSVR